MEKNTLVLTDNTKVELETGGDIGSLQVLSPDKESMAATWGRLTPANLAAVQIRNGDGLIRGNYSGLVLDSETSIIQPDGTILTTFHLRQKTELELLTERLAAVEESQTVQDGAITDLGEVASTLAEQMEGGVQ